MPRVTRTELARNLGVSQSAITHAVTAGRLEFGPDNRCDLEDALRDWEANAHPGRRAATGRGKGVPQQRAKKAIPTEAVDAARDVIEDGTGVRPTGTMTFAEAKTANEILKAQQAKLKLDKLRGSLVSCDGAERAVFELARQERDSWLQWPARVAAIMAAELGIDPARLQSQMDRHIREHLASMADATVQLR